MVSQTARQRINTISAHLTAGLLTEDVTAPSANLFPVNCSSSLSTPFRRLDNRLHYGRQASTSLGYFMRQAESPTNETNCSSKASNLSIPFRRLDNRLLYGRQSSASQGYFMRQAVSPMNETETPLNETGNSGQFDISCKRYMNEKKPSVTPTPPLFNRLGSGEPRFARPEAELNWLAKISGQSQDPKFERPIEDSQKPITASQVEGKELLPRMNVAESKRSYVITVELPGVDIRDIRVETDDKSLIVKGKRSSDWWKGTGFSTDSGVTYHKREISQGQYKVVLPLPAAANKNSISAEFMEGILQITIPKL